MSDHLRPNGQALQGGVILGGRQLTITIPREAEERLKIISRSSGQSVHELATMMLLQSLHATWQDWLRARFVFQLTRWYAWPR